MSNAIQKAETQELAHVENVSPMLAMIERAARDPSVDIDKMERLMQMKERADAKVAETAFNDAMNRAQSQTHRIKADKTNSQTRSEYATYAALDRALRPIYTECGFSLSFDTGDAPPETVRVLCYVSHNAGFTRTYRVDMPADGKGAKGGDVMTKTHAAGSAMSYGSRYLLKLIFNVAIGEDDDDGNSASNTKRDSAALDWIDVANGLQSMEGYKEHKARLVAAYGSADKVPKDVISAFNRAFAKLKDTAK